MLHRRLAGVAILVVACNGDPSIHELFSDEVSTVCGRVFDCESQYDPSMHGGEPFSQFAGGTDVNGCETMLDGLLGSAADTAQTEVDAGRVRYDASEGKACIDGFGAATCDEVLQQNGAQFPSSAACQDTFIGLVADGSACVVSEDCANEDDCVGSPMTCEQPTPGGSADVVYGRVRRRRAG